MDPSISDLPKPVADLVVSLHDHTDRVEVPQDQTGQISGFIEFNQNYVPHQTETLYVPDLVPGQFQPLEEINDETLRLLDIDAMIAAESVEKQALDLGLILSTQQSEQLDQNSQSLQSMQKMDCSDQPALLKLHKPVAKPVKKSASKKIVPSKQFLPPVSDDAVDNMWLKR